MTTISMNDLDSVCGGYDKAAAKRAGEDWGYATAAVAAPVVGTVMGLRDGYQAGWGGTAIGGLAGYGVGYAAGYAKTAWQTRGQK